jgi:hypothetical protein
MTWRPWAFLPAGGGYGATGKKPIAAGSHQRSVEQRGGNRNSSDAETLLSRKILVAAAQTSVPARYGPVAAAVDWDLGGGSRRSGRRVGLRTGEVERREKNWPITASILDDPNGKTKSPICSQGEK